jgi:hypothetical protein
MKWKELNSQQKISWAKGFCIDLSLLFGPWVLIINYQLLPSLDQFTIITNILIPNITTTFDMLQYTIFSIFGIVGPFLLWRAIYGRISNWLLDHFHLPRSIKEIKPSIT